MDLSAYSLQKLSREKRERQPNWTESEKQLLLTLTRKHQAILENKGSDTMTLKRKSEAWEDIAMQMRAAGYNRSKERLKQQLGRIRANEAKKIKDITERNLTIEEIQKLNLNNNNLIMLENMKILKTPFVNGNSEDMTQTSSSLKIRSLPIPEALQEHHYIKTETSVTNNDGIAFAQEVGDVQRDICSSSSNNVSNELIKNACESNTTGGDYKIAANVYFKLQNVQSLAENQQNIDGNTSLNEVNVSNTANNNTNSPTIMENINKSPPPALLNRQESNISSNSDEDENIASSSFSATANMNQIMQQQQQQQQRLLRLRRIRTRRIRSSFTRQQSLRQLYTYRIAIERERLRNLRIQQKRDRILYRKDIEIQNLKLQILQNLTNQNHDANRFNF